MGRRTAFVAEEEEIVTDIEALAAGGEPDRWLVGTFAAHVEDTDAPELLEWTVTAATAEQALAPLRDRLVPPPGWEVRLSAEPAVPADR